MTGRKWRIGVPAAAIGLVLCAGAAEGQCYLAAYQMPDQLGEEGDYFGFDVAYDLPYMAIGAPGWPGWTAPEQTGAVWWSSGSGAVLVPLDAADGDRFGHSVALDNGVLVGGAPGHDDPAMGAGAAYVFDWLTGWTKLTASDAHAFGLFGEDVAICGETVVVGSNDAAYVFDRDLGGPGAWGELKKLTPSGGAAGFGNAVAIEGDRIVVGGKDYSGSLGAAWVFERDASGPNNWGEVAMIPNPGDPLVWDFGRAIALDGDTLVFGADADTPSAGWVGTAYVFQRSAAQPDEWEQVARLNPSQVDFAAFFGWSVALSGDTALIGARSCIDGGVVENPGSAWVFKRNHGGPNAWGEFTRIHELDPYDSNWFGYSVALAGDVALVGAPGCEGFYIGEAFLLHIPGCHCSGDINYEGIVDVTDLLALLAAWGATSGPEDINGDGIVDVLDLLELLANWGPC